MIASPDYRADLDVVITAPDGTIAAFAFCWLDPENQLGELERVGTHPDHRRRGLARAACAEACARAFARGAKQMLVYSAEEDATALALYRSLGFHRFDRSRRWVMQGPPR